MGCDIHAATEKRIDNKWVMVDRLHWSCNATQRNYRRFAALAGVRGDGPDPNGFPDDASESTKLYHHEWRGDAHSDSWLPSREAAEIWLETDYEEALADYIKDYPESHYFDLEMSARPGTYRVVFWFDN
jgi:hypothetical protein